MANAYLFTGGAGPIPGYGDRWRIVFGGTWAVGDTWSIDLTSSSGDILIGTGNLTSIAVTGPTSCFTFRNRVYLAAGQQFDFSDNSDPTGWQVQNPGASFIKYLSQFGGQDKVVGFSQLQGRLVVGGQRSIQIWTADADPTQFALVQTLDNIGFLSPLATQNLGDYDDLFLDYTGVRSLRSKEVTLNAFVDDVGSPIDGTIVAALVGYDITKACSVVEPKNRNYWLLVNGTIYVLSRHPGSKITAWSTFTPTDNAGVTFTPEKFVVFSGTIYIRSAASRLYVYGDSNNTTYDTNAASQVSVQLPWLDDKKPGTYKNFQGVSLTLQGKWKVNVSTDPISGIFTVPDTYIGGSAATPNQLKDSTYDTGRIPFEAHATHVSMTLVSQNTSTSTPAIISAVSFYYDEGESAG